MGLLTREQIIAVSDIDVETVAVPEWDGEVMVKGMNGAERDAFEASRLKIDGKKVAFDSVNVRAKVCAFCIVDDQGNRVFSDKDVELLGRKSASALDRVFEVAQRLSGLSGKDMDTLAGNSESGPSSSSTTGSA